jgi:hypothetical protein
VGGVADAHDVSIPGVQNPHWSASFFTNSATSACPAAEVATPSTVVIVRPSASTASIMQALIGYP